MDINEAAARGLVSGTGSGEHPDLVRAVMDYDIAR